ncbi:MAG: hypothetical protein ABIR82_08010 [Nocardioides sp.]
MQRDRIGEALAVLWSEVNLDEGTVSITSTLIRVKGEGLLRTHEDTHRGAGPRTSVECGRRAPPALHDRRPAGPACLPCPTRRFPCSHTFGKTAATMLDEAGLSARLIADQLGHARPSMTHDVYLTRHAFDDQAGPTLDSALWDTTAER